VNAGRPSQLQFNHVVVIDYFAWSVYPVIIHSRPAVRRCSSLSCSPPFTEVLMTGSYSPRPGLRERFTLSPPQVHLSNKFWKYFALSFRFFWPYDERDAYYLDDTTGFYQFSGLYERHVRDIKTWMMTMDFFEAFPEMYDDIMPFTDLGSYHHLLADPLRSRPPGTTPGDNHEGEDSIRGQSALPNVGVAAFRPQFSSFRSKYQRS